MASIADLKVKFESLPTKVGLKFLRRAGRAAAMIIRNRAADLAPVATGKLHGEILIKTKKESDASIEVSIGPSKNAWYGRLQEFGTVHHPPQPFLGPALEEKGAEAAALFAEELRKEIGSHFKGD